MGSSGGGSASKTAKSVNKISSGAASQASNLTGGMPGQNLGQDYSGNLQQGAQQLIDLTQGGQAYQTLAGANSAAELGGNIANQAGNYAYSLFPYAQSMQGWSQDLIPKGQDLFSRGAQVGEMGFDDRKDLYNRTLQQTQEQQRVAQATRGVSMSPYGAGLEADATKNFNIDWQNQQLDRAIKAGEAQKDLYGQGGGLYSTAADIGKTSSDIGAQAFNIGSGATDLYASSSRLPYDTQKGLYEDKNNAYTNVGSQISQLNQPRQQTINDYLQAAGLGSAYTNAASNQQNANTGSNTAIAKTLTSLIGK